MPILQFWSPDTFGLVRDTVALLSVTSHNQCSGHHNPWQSIAMPDWLAIPLVPPKLVLFQRAVVQDQNGADYIRQRYFPVPRTFDHSC